MAPARSTSAPVKAASGKPEDLKKVLEMLQAHSSSLASFILRWKEIEDHLSSIQRSIEDQFRELQATEEDCCPPAAASCSRAVPRLLEEETRGAEEEPEVEPRPELKSLCVKMDGKGLRAFVVVNRKKDLLNIQRELKGAIRAAADPARLVLDAMDGLYPAWAAGADGPTGDLRFIPANRRTCIVLLELLHRISPEIKHPVRDMAVKLARGWRGKISSSPDWSDDSQAFLQLLVSYGITSEFDADDLLDILVNVSRRKQAIDLLRNLGLPEKVPEFVQKLVDRGKHLDAVKFVYAFQLVDKFRPVPLLKEYLKIAKKNAQECRKKALYSAESLHNSTSQELAALRAVIKAIGEYMLESEYSPEGPQKRVAQLEQEMAEMKKRSAVKAEAKISETQAQQQQTDKRPRPSNIAATAAVPALPPVPVSQAHPRVPVADRASYLPFTGPSGLSGSSSLYDHTASVPRSSLYSFPLVGSVSYDSSGAYGDYPLSGGLLHQYKSTLYP